MLGNRMLIVNVKGANSIYKGVYVGNTKFGK